MGRNPCQQPVNMVQWGPESEQGPQELLEEYVAVCGVLFCLCGGAPFQGSQNTTSPQLQTTSFPHRAGKGKIVLRNDSAEEVTKENNYILQGTPRVAARKKRSKGTWCTF